MSPRTMHRPYVRIVVCLLLLAAVMFLAMRKAHGAGDSARALAAAVSRSHG